jgi:hypothetical protein
MGAHSAIHNEEQPSSVQKLDIPLSDKIPRLCAPLYISTYPPVSFLAWLAILVSSDQGWRHWLIMCLAATCASACEDDRLLLSTFLSICYSPCPARDSPLGMSRSVAFVAKSFD